MASDTANRYLNRELSWLEFNHRVLEEANNGDLPLLERLKFLAITASNLDEFFMVRVGGLQMLLDAENTRRDPSGLTPAEQLQAIRERVQDMTTLQYQTFAELQDALAEAGVKRIQSPDMNERQYQLLDKLFEDEISSIFAPVMVDLPAAEYDEESEGESGSGEEPPGLGLAADEQDFPLLANLGLYLSMLVQAEHEPPRLMLMACKSDLGRFVTLPADDGYCYMLIEDLLAATAERFFPGERVLECAPLRVTRNADLSLQEDSAADLLEEMQQILKARKVSHCVRCEIAATASDQLCQLLADGLGIVVDDMLRIAGPIYLGDFMQLASVHGFDHLRPTPWPALPTPQVDQTRSIFEVLQEGDVLLYHPYDSFEPVIRMIEDAAQDPDVLAIKQTLYRTSRNSPVVAALSRAARAGKRVTVIVELKARFDEARNIEWAKNLENEAVQVFYGVKGLKTHAKICIVIRREADGVRKYVHFGTGNYNEATARLYSDVSYMTCDDQLGADATRFFNAVTGYTHPPRFNHIEAAPVGLREKLLEMIQVERDRARDGQKAHIVAKINSLADTKMINALYEASQAGVQIRLNVRGICCLKPGVPGLSETIEVISIVDRYLEHARVFYFYHGGDERVFISSADWMPRNLDRRVELLVPIDDPVCRRRLLTILDRYFQDNTKAKRLLSDGSYEPVQSDGPEVRSQESLYHDVVRAVRSQRQSRPTTFEPHKSAKGN